MSSPKSFRDMIVSTGPVSRSHSYPSPPPAVQAPPGYYEQRSLQQKEMIRLVNSHRCPLCGAQLDGGVYATVADVYCRANPDEYHAHYKRGISIPTSSIQRIYYPQIMYEVASEHMFEEVYHNVIYTVDMTLNARERTKSKKKLVDLECARIVLSNKFDEPKLLKKIKSYRLFG